MRKTWTFDEQYYKDAIAKIDTMIAAKNLSPEQVKLLEEDKLYLYDWLGEKPIEQEQRIVLVDALAKIEKKMRLELSKIGEKDIYYIYNIVDFIARQSNEQEILFETKVEDKNEVFNKVLNFYRSFDLGFYNIAKQLYEYKLNLYNISDNPNTEDECVFMNYNKLPIVNIYDTKNTLIYYKLVHEMQHQIDNVMNNHKYHNYHGFNHLLRECSAIFSELVFCDQESKKRPNSKDINNLYLKRIENIENLSFNMKEYLNIMLIFEDPDTHLDFRTFSNFMMESFYGITEESLLSYVSHLLEFNIFEEIKYLFSYLVALDIREIYNTNSKEALRLIKYIIDLNLYDSNLDALKKKGIRLDVYKDGPYSHLRHLMNVEQKRLILDKVK